jgi:hypothetical protein
VELTKPQKEACKWSWGEGLTVRLRLETAGVDCGLHEALALSNLRPGEALALCPRWAVDERLPPEQQQPFTPTPKQVLYGSRCDLGSIATDRDGQGHITAGHVEVTLRQAFGNKAFLPFVFGAIDRPLEDGKVYTRRLPVVQSREEVRLVFASLDGVPLLVCSLLYGAGLRRKGPGAWFRSTVTDADPQPGSSAATPYIQTLGLPCTGRRRRARMRLPLAVAGRRQPPVRTNGWSRPARPDALAATSAVHPST